MATATSSAQRRQTAKRTLRVGIHPEPGLGELAKDVAEGLSEDLAERFPGFEWEIDVAEESAKDPAAKASELVRHVREKMLKSGWDVAICLTNLPLRRNRRPVTAYASATEGVGLVSVPALGAVDRERRVREAAVNLIESLVGDGPHSPDGVRGRLRELASPLGHAQTRRDGTIRFTTATIRGNLRLLIGMVRANRPSRVIVRLSRVTVAAAGTGAWALASSSVWSIAVGSTWQRLLALSVASVVVAAATLIAAHGLWERAKRPEERERVVLFNTATTLTIFLGVLSQYLALFAVALLCGLALIPSDVFAAQVSRPADTTTYLHLAWLGATLATIVGALGSLVESDLAVREAAYRHQPDVPQDDDTHDA